MCGLTGLWRIKGAADKAEITACAETMAGSLRHRGPDSGGVWTDETNNVVLAHRRLSILDLSPEGAQPMHSPSGRFVIVFNGEIYNFASIREELAALGARFRGRSDTEVLLHSIEIKGLGRTLQSINGMFAIVLWDMQRRQMHFIRDRFGEKPLYCGWAGGDLVFASELKAIRRHPVFEPHINQLALTYYMERGYVPAPYSIYKNVWSVQPGHILTLSAENCMPGQGVMERAVPYWSAAEAALNALSLRQQPEEGAAVTDFECLLDTCVQGRMISDVPLGAFLSGGLDSTAIVALMQKNSSRPVQTYTIGFAEAGFDEAAHAGRIARHLGTDHHELYVDGEAARRVIPALADMYDEPFADISAIPTFLVAQFARQNVTVALSGDGGDEMLGGYARYTDAADLWARVKWMPAAVRRGLGRALQAVPPEAWDRAFPRRPQAGHAVHKAAGLLQEAGEEEIYAGLLRRGKASLLRAPARMEGMEENNFSAQKMASLNFSEKMMLRDVLSWMPDDVLVKVDRASMAVSLEARAPFLDPRLWEFAWSLPPRMRIRQGKGKWILREMLKKHVPPTLFERPKQGFNMPVGGWLRGPLKEWAADLLHRGALAQDQYLDAPFVDRLWSAHLQGRGNHAHALWTVLMYRAWRKGWL